MLAAALLAGAAAAQERPLVHAAFAGAAERASLPGLVWLCETWLPAQPQWPTDLAPREPLVVEWSTTGLSIQRSKLDLPAGVAAAGTVTFSAGQSVLWRCDRDGLEDWFAPRTLLAPPSWRGQLAALAANVVGSPRTLDLPVLFGHLAGAFCEGDPRRELQIGATACGEATWIAWTTPSHLRVRGRSGGGLALPAALLAAASEGTPTATSHALRAFAARDGDSSEATRQLLRDDRSGEPLRALLHGDDAVRLSAIDALVRLGASDALPEIVAAAKPDLPWAQLAASDAVRILWPFAAPAVRLATRAAIAASSSTLLRSLDLPEPTAERTPPAAVAPPRFRWPELTLEARSRLLAAIGILALCIYGCWLRERELLRAFGV